MIYYYKNKNDIFVKCGKYPLHYPVNVYDMRGVRKLLIKYEPIEAYTEPVFDFMSNKYILQKIEEYQAFNEDVNICLKPEEEERTMRLPVKMD